MLVATIFGNSSEIAVRNLIRREKNEKRDEKLGHEMGFIFRWQPLGKNLGFWGRKSRVLKYF